MDTLKALRIRHVSLARRRARFDIAALTLALALGACGAEDEKKTTPKPPAGDGSDGDGSDGTAGDGSDGSADGAAGDGADGSNDGSDGSSDAPVELPYAVDNSYTAGGFMGAAESIAALPSVENMDSTCGENRPTGTPAGHCHTFTYTLSTNAALEPWAGVFWQYPTENWLYEGLAIEPGATSVSFQARADSPVTLKFVAGMASDMALGAETWKRETDPITLTTEWTTYKVDLTGQSYDKVTGAFAWTIDNAAQTGAGPFKFYLDDIQWVK